MVSLKVKYQRPRPGKCEGFVYYQLRSRERTGKIISGIALRVTDWDRRRKMINDNKCDEISAQIREKARRTIITDLRRINRIAESLERNGATVTVEDIIFEHKRQLREFTMFTFTRHLISNLKNNGHYRTSETYSSALNKFSLFREGKDVMIDCIDAEMMERFEAWLSKHRLTKNSTSFYMRILRAVYNRAVDLGATDDLKPFRNVYTGIGKTIKRALPLALISRINALDLSFSPPLDYARDIFMLSFMLRGMSFIDMAFLKKSDLNGRHIIYHRSKTGKLLTIKWTDQMQRIVGKYSRWQSSEYLLPILDRQDDDMRMAYKRVGARINTNLKKLGKLIGSQSPLTLYVARHSWASAARSKGIPLSIISEGLGHESESTTRIYLSSLDTTSVDRANSIILSAL